MSTPPAPQPETISDHDLRVLTLVLSLGALASILDATIANIAVAPLSRAFTAPLGSVQWAVTGFLLAMSAAAPAAGWVIDRVGAHATWQASLLGFLLISLACGMAWNLPSLIVFRVLQGAIAGLFPPTLMTVLGRAAGKNRMTQAMGAFALVAQLGPILGPIVAGGLLTVASWRWLFWVNIPLCLLGYLLAARALPTEPPATGRDARFDWIGLLLATPGLSLFVYGLTRAGHGDAALWLPIGLALLAAAGAWSWRRGPQALVDVRLFARPSFAVANLLSVAAGFCMYGGLILLPLWLEQVRHASLLTVGLILAPQGVGAALPVLAGPRFTDPISPRGRILAGFALISLGTLPFVTTTPTWLQVLGLLVRGIGTGASTPAITATALTDIDPRRIPAASSTYNVVQRIGAPLGTAITTTLLTQALSHHGVSWAYSATFWAILASAAIPVLLALFLPQRS